MRDSQHDGQGDRGGDGLAVLARTVVARLAARDGPGRYLGQTLGPALGQTFGHRPLDEDLVAALARALVSPDPARFEALRPDLRRARIGDIELADVYFPAVARALGCAWAEDRAGFAEVTLGTARMQAMLRQIGREWASNAHATRDSATVLMVVPEGEQHTFGAMVLTGQLRRRGISVQVQLGRRLRDLRALVADRGFDCAMVSVAGDDRLAHCAKVVTALKEASGGGLWVAVGGAVLDRPVDVARLTGADIVTNDAGLALHGARPHPGGKRGHMGPPMPSDAEGRPSRRP